uniref:Uncharacterized protein n=1 Tax=Anopheles melas TaxID=34690 RepID=A0A182U8D2_9DIPT
MDEDRDETDSTSSDSLSTNRMSYRLLKLHALEWVVKTNRMLLRLPPGRYMRYHQRLLNRFASDLRTVADYRVVEIMQMIDSIMCCIMMRIKSRARKERRAKMLAEQRQ